MAICSLFLLLASAVYAAGAVFARRSPDYREQMDIGEAEDPEHESSNGTEEADLVDAPLLAQHEQHARSDT